MTDRIEEAKALHQQEIATYGLRAEKIMPPEWAYNTAAKINNKLELGLSAKELNWLTRQIWKARPKSAR